MVKKATFVLTGDGYERKVFKQRLLGFVNDGVSRLRYRYNVALGAVKKALNSFDFRTAAKEALIWTIEAAIEGLVINFSLHQVFGLKFTPLMSLAYGFMVKEFIYVVQRLKSGADKPLLDKDDPSK